jgi:Ca-activated chloride channel homolog
VGRNTAKVITAVLLAASAAGGVLLYAQDQPVFVVDVRLVRILATVKDNNGALIGSLQKEDFAVYDNGVKQEVAVFERQTEQPLSVSLLVDTSASTAKELQYQMRSVRRFLDALFREGNPADAASLYSFNYDVTLHTTFTRRLQRLEAGLKELKPEGGTSMYDGICFASSRLEDREGRHVIILVTDGGDTTSRKTFQEAREAIHRADAVVYPILVMPITNDAGRNIGGENALQVLAQDSGGRVFTPTIGPMLDEAFTEILRDLRTQYLLGFYPKNVPVTKQRFHRLDVKVSRPGLHVLSRTGYFGEAEAGVNAPGRGPRLPASNRQ